MTPEQRREWLEWRRGGIGASDVAALVGLSKWATPMTVWLDKTQPVKDDDDDAGEWLRWGQLLENPILDEWERRTGTAAIERQSTVHRHLDPHHRCTVDALGADTPDAALPTEVIEVKLDGSHKWDEVPDAYVCQCQWQMWVTGLDRARILVLHNGRRLDDWTVDRDDQLIAALVERVDQFWHDYVIPKRLPPVDGRDETSAALAHLYPQHAEGSTVDLDPDLYADYQRAKADADFANAELTELEQMIKVAMGDAETALVDGRPVFTWRTTTSSRIDTKKIREKHPRITKWCTVETTSRRFLPKTPKGTPDA